MSEPWLFWKAGITARPKISNRWSSRFSPHRVVVSSLYISTLKKSEQAEQVLRGIVESVPVPV